MHVGMEVIESAGDRFPPDSSSNSADPLSSGEREEELFIFMLTHVIPEYKQYCIKNASQ